MKKVNKIFIAIFVITSILCFNIYGQVFPINVQWKFNHGDNTLWALDTKTEPSWQDFQMPASIPVKDDGFIWIKAQIPVPDYFDNEQLYLECGHGSAAMDFYADGILFGHHGYIEPELNISIVDNSVIPVPKNLIHNGMINLSVRCKSGSSHATFSQFRFVNKAQYLKIELFQKFLNGNLNYMLAAVCFVLGIYFLFQFFSDKNDRPSLSFAFTLIFISVYFFDLATDISFLPIMIQQTIARVCLIYSVGCLVIFIMRFFKQEVRIARIIIFSIFAILTVAYAICAKDDLAHETLFTLSLLPVFAGIVCIYIVLIKVVRQRQSFAVFILLGITFAIMFALHDIIYQALGLTPFAWLQSFSFFAINMTMFIVVSLENAQRKKMLDEYMKTTSQQKEKLNKIVEKASKLSEETMQIANRLNDSVNNVATIADKSAKEAENIGSYINNQSDAIKDTSLAMENLVESLQTVNNELQEEIKAVQNTATETQQLVAGVNQVAEGIVGTEKFAQSLGDLTAQGCKNVNMLSKHMEDVKKSSEQILGVVSIVSDFAERTNMLAMNASIEAAHAGIYGKGFAVIAGEIKKLAAASAGQVEKIRDIVTEINENINSSFDLSIHVKNSLLKVADGASETTERISESSEEMENQRIVGNRILQTTLTLAESTNKVKKEASQQFNYSQQVATNMTELSDSAEQVNVAVHDIVNKSKDLAREMIGLLALAHRAKEAAGGLNDMLH
ncbi:MAG: hypothetical protein GX220_02905 [Treponema sp.]|nr:hypothetical protein [Treponema sp.]